MARVVDKSLLVVLAILACIEKLGSVMNLVAVERDWVCHDTITTFQANRVDRLSLSLARIVGV